LKSSALRVANHPAQAETRNLSLRRVVALARSTIRTRVHRALFGRPRPQWRRGTSNDVPGQRSCPLVLTRALTRLEILFAVTGVCHPAALCSGQRGPSGREWSQAQAAEVLSVLPSMPVDGYARTPGTRTSAPSRTRRGSLSPRRQAGPGVIRRSRLGPSRRPRQMPGNTWPLFATGCYPVAAS